MHCEGRMFLVVQACSLEKFSQNFLYNKSVQLPEMMKLRPHDCVLSSSAWAMKEKKKQNQPKTNKHAKKALTDIGENKASHKPFHFPVKSILLSF